MYIVEGLLLKFVTEMNMFDVVKYFMFEACFTTYPDHI